MEAAVNYSKTKDENVLYEALVKVTNLKDSAINDALNIGEITLAEFNKTLTDVDNLIKDYQNSAKEFYEESEFLKKEYGEDSDIYLQMKKLSSDLENELISLYHDRDEIIIRIDNIKKMMDEL
jgi:chromosome segregation ATPase